MRGKTRIITPRGTGGWGNTRETYVTSCIITSRGTGGWGNTRETCVRREFIASNPRNSAWGPRVAWNTAHAARLLLLSSAQHVVPSINLMTTIEQLGHAKFLKHVRLFGSLIISNSACANPVVLRC